MKFLGLLALLLAFVPPARAEVPTTSQLQKAIGFNSAVYDVLDAMGNDKDPYRWGRVLVLLQTARSLTVNTDVRAELDLARNTLSSGASNGGKWPDPSDATADDARTDLLNAIRFNRYVVRETFGPEDRQVISNLLLRVFFPGVDTQGMVQIHVVPADEDRWGPNTCQGEAAQIVLAGRSLTKFRPARPPEARGLGLLMNLALDPRAKKYDPDVAHLLAGENPQGGEGDDQIIFCVSTGAYPIPARTDDPKRARVLDLASTYRGLTVQGGDLMAVPVIDDHSISFKLEYKGLKSVPAILHFVRNYKVLRAMDTHLLEPMANRLARIIASMSASMSGATGSAGREAMLTSLKRISIYLDNKASYYSGLSSQSMNRMLTAQERIDRIAANDKLETSEEVAANPKVQAINEAVEEMHDTPAYKAAEARGDEAGMTELDSVAARSADPLEMSGGVNLGATIAVGAMIAFYGFEATMEWRRTDDPDEHRMIVDEYAPMMVEAPFFLIPVAGWILAGYDSIVSAYNLYADSNGMTPYHVTLADGLRPIVDDLWEKNVESFRSVEDILSPLQDRMRLPRVIEHGASADQELANFRTEVDQTKDGKNGGLCTLQLDRGMYYQHIRELARSYLAYLNIGRERFGQRTAEYYRYEGKLNAALFAGEAALFSQETAQLNRADAALGGKNACDLGLKIAVEKKPH